MRRSMMVAKLHGIRVTGADLHYEGSVEIDADLCDQAGLLPLQFVEIWNKSSGARLSTYVIHGKPGSASCVLNGAAARTCQVGDEIIIAARAELTEEELLRVRPRVLILDQANRVMKTVEYSWHQSSESRWRAAPLRNESHD